MLLHLGLNVITFRTLLHLGPNVIIFRTLLHLGHLLHLGLQQRDGELASERFRWGCSTEPIKIWREKGNCLWQDGGKKTSESHAWHNEIPFLEHTLTSRECLTCGSSQVQNQLKLCQLSTTLPDSCVIIQKLHSIKNHNQIQNTLFWWGST